MTQIIRSLRGLWRTERLLFCIMTVCIFSSALLMQFSYGLWQNYHVTLLESEDDLKQISASVADGQKLRVGDVRDYIQALPQEITDNVTNFFVPVYFGCLTDHIDRTDEEWEALRREYADLLHDDIPEEIMQQDNSLYDQIMDAEQGKSDLSEDEIERLRQARLDLLAPYREKDIQHHIYDYYEEEDRYLGSIGLRFTYRNGDFAPSDIYQDNMEKNHWMQDGDRFFTKEEYATGAHVVYNAGNEDVAAYLKLDENHISMWGEPYEVIVKKGGDSAPDPPITAVPADCYTPSGDVFGFEFDRNIRKSEYDTMRTLAEEMMPGVLVFPELPFPDNDSMYLSRNIMLISALIAVLSVLNFVMLYHFILQRRSRSLAIFRMTGCTAFKAVRMYLGECFLLGIPVYLLGLLLFVILLKYAFGGIFPYMAGAFSIRVYAAIFALYLLTMLVMLTVMVTHHVRQKILSEYYGREDS